MPANPTLEQSEISRAALELYRNSSDDYERQLLIDCRYRTPAAAAKLFEQHVVDRDAGAWLDLGAGTGLVGQALNEAGIALSLYALDNSKAMLRKLHGEAYLACYLSDVLEPLPFSEASLAGVFAIGLSEHIVDLEPLFANVARCLKRQGCLLFSYCPSHTEEVAQESRGSWRIHRAEYAEHSTATVST